MATTTTSRADDLLVRLIEVLCQPFVLAEAPLPLLDAIMIEHNQGKLPDRGRVIAELIRRADRFAEDTIRIAEREDEQAQRKIDPSWPV